MMNQKTKRRSVINKKIRKYGCSLNHISFKHQRDSIDILLFHWTKKMTKRFYGDKELTELNTIMYLFQVLKTYWSAFLCVKYGNGFNVGYVYCDSSQGTSFRTNDNSVWVCRIHSYRTSKRSNKLQIKMKFSIKINHLSVWK